MKRFFILFLIFILGCNSKTTSIDKFLHNLDNKLSKSEKNIIKECPDIGCLVIFVQTNVLKKFSDAYIVNANDIDRYLIDSFKINAPNDRNRALFLAYQKKLIGKEIDFVEIKNEISKYDQLQDSLYSNVEEIEIKTRSELAKNNFDQFQVGDTLNLELPLGRDGNTKVVYYYTQYNNSNFKDTLFIKGILMRKTIEVAEQSEFAHDEYIFLVKILETNNKEINLVEKKYQKGNIITLPLYDYGRMIIK